MSGVIFPKVHVPVKSLVEIIKQEQKRREDCRKRLEQKAEFMLKKRLEKILRVHKFEKAVRNSAKQGKNTVEIPLKKRYRFSCDMSSPYLELRDKKFDIHVSISHNQFLTALEQSLYEEKQIEGNIFVENEEQSPISNVSSLLIEWEDLQPLPVTFDFLWESEFRISDVDEKESFSDLFNRKGFLPRDGTRLVITLDRQRIRMNQKVKPFFGKTLIVRPENYNELEAVDL